MQLPNYANQTLDECGSTNDLARALGEAGAPHGTWVSTRRQNAGRGRVGREWKGIEGNLLFSLVARVEPKDRWTWVPLATAIGVARGIAKQLPASPPVKIKWPNDLWIDGAKLGGILCEAIGAREQSFIVIGLGLNCFARPKLGPDAQRTVDLGGVHADEIRAPLIESILCALAELASPAPGAGPSALAQAYEDRAAFPIGTNVQWQDPRTSAKAAGEVRGLGISGELLVDIAGRGVTPLYAEDIKAVRKAGGGSRP